MNDIEIAEKTLKNNIVDIANNLGIDEEDLTLYGNYKAKVNMKDTKEYGKLILVTAINPTPYGEGKTTVSIGLADALHKLNKKVSLALREPSQGPVFGMKGGATGGGYSQVVPMEDINLHFTGDFAAIEAANNLLCAAIDNHIEKGNSLDIQQITFNRCLDVNDRSLRRIIINGKETSFDITAASEIMALFCLAKNMDDLKEKLGNIVIGYNSNNEEVYAKELKIEGALTVILKDAINPNLVQTLEHTPAFIHGGPFANIAHGCNSIIATKTALSYSDIVVTEAGFGSDLGAEKFFDIKCRKAGLKPDCIVLVATIKALKYNAGVDKENILVENIDKVKEGMDNLKIHLENMKKFNSNIVICLNKYDTDTKEEIEVVSNFAKENKVPFEVSTAYLDGGEGAVSLAEKVLENLDNNKFEYIYDDNNTITEKISLIAKEIYRSKEIELDQEAVDKINNLEEKGFGNLPLCIAKTQYSISDDPKKLNAPIDNTLHVIDVRLYNGAGFITVLTGNIMTMPGLPSVPNYEKIDYVNNKVVGLS